MSLPARCGSGSFLRVNLVSLPRIVARMETVSSIAELRESRAVQQQLLDTLESLKDIAASEGRKATLQDRINVIAQHIRDIDLVIEAHEQAFFVTILKRVF